LSLAVVVEGDTDLPVARHLAHDAGLTVHLALDQGGKDALDRELPAFNRAARGSPWLVLRDLDHDAGCAPAFLRERRFRPEPWMCFRLAVREMEAWLMADRRALARFLGIVASRIPADPDAEPDPTGTLVALARSARSRRIREAMVPRAGIAARVGILYESTIIEFAREHWSLERASGASASLRRARAALHALAGRWQAHVAGGG